MAENWCFMIFAVCAVISCCRCSLSIHYFWKKTIDRSGKCCRSLPDEQFWAFFLLSIDSRNCDNNMLIQCSKPMVSCHKSTRYEPVFSSSLFGRFYFMHSLRSKILPNLKKKSRRFFLKMKKVRDTFRKNFENFRDFSKFLTFSKIFDFSIFFYRTSYRKFSKKSKFFENIKNLKISDFFSQSISNFFHFQKFSMIFFYRSK